MVTKKFLLKKIESLESENKLLWNATKSLVKRVAKLEKEVFKSEPNPLDIIQDSLTDKRLEEAQKFIRKGK